MFAHTAGFAQKLISAFVSGMLVTSLVPAGSVAFATEGGSDATVADAIAASATDAETSASEADATTDAAAERIYESIQIEDGAASDTTSAPTEKSSSSEVAQAPAQATIERVSVQVSLQGAHTALTFDNLTFIVDDEAHTATLTGIASTAIAGTLDIPATIANNGVSYAVTNISSTMELRGGGMRASA